MRINGCSVHCYHILHVHGANINAETPLNNAKSNDHGISTLNTWIRIPIEKQLMA